MTGHGAVIVTASAVDVRQLVGPYAWVVLEHLAERTDPTTPDTAIETSTRELSTRLAISKDTVTRALRRLIDAGLVERAVARETTGQFGNAAYRVRLDRTGLRLLEDAHESTADRPAPSIDEVPVPELTPSPSRSTPRRRRAPQRDTQLSLLDALAEPDS